MSTLETSVLSEIKRLSDNLTEAGVKYRSRVEEVETRLKNEEEKRAELDKKLNAEIAKTSEYAGEVSLLKADFVNALKEFNQVEREYVLKENMSGRELNSEFGQKKNVLLQTRAIDALLRSRLKFSKAEELLSKDNFFESSPELRTKALSSLIGQDGGFLIPQELSNEIISLATTTGETRQVVAGKAVSTNKISFPQGGGIAASFGNEDDPYPEVSHEGFSMVEIPVWDIKGTIKIPNNLLADSSFNIVQYFTQQIYKKIASLEEEKFAIGLGAGAKEPQGIFTHPDLTSTVYNKTTNPNGYIKTGVAAALNDATHNGVDVFKRDLRYCLNSEYRMNGHYMMNSLTFSEIFTLKDDNGQYLLQQGNLANPTTLLGNRVYFNEFIPDVAANAFVAGFGNLPSAYYIVDREGLFSWQSVEVARLEDKLTIGFKKRLGANIVLSEAFKLLKVEA